VLSAGYRASSHSSDQSREGGWGQRLIRSCPTLSRRSPLRWIKPFRARSRSAMKPSVL
jgi:hypothetical protein